MTLGSLFDGIGGFPYAAFIASTLSCQNGSCCDGSDLKTVRCCSAHSDGAWRHGIKPVWASEILPQAISVTKRHFPEMEHVGDITGLDGAELAPVDIISFGSPCQDLSIAAGNRQGLSGQRSGLFYEAIRIINEMQEETNGRYPSFAIWENVPGATSSNNGLEFKAVLEAFTQSEVPMPASGRWAAAGMVRGCRADIAWRHLSAQHFGLAQRRRRLYLVADFRGERTAEILFIDHCMRWYFAARREARQGASCHAEGCLRGAGSKGNSGCLKLCDTQHCNRKEDKQTTELTGSDHINKYLEGSVASFCVGAGASIQNIGYSETVTTTLRSSPGGTIGLCYKEKEPKEFVLCAASGMPNAEIMQDHAPTLTCCHDQPYICKAISFSQSPGGNIVTSPTTNTLTASYSTSSCNAPLVAQTVITVGDESEAENTNRDSDPPASYAIQGNIINRKDGNGAQGKGYMKEACFTLTSGDVHAVADAPHGYILRRLTPREAERLQGFPDDYTALGQDGKAISDSKRYMMLGNSVAIPCVVFIFAGIVKQFRKEDHALAK